jgi:CHAT domain-containing protein
VAEGYILWREATITRGATLGDYLVPLEIAKEAGNLSLQGLINTSLMAYLSEGGHLEAAIFFGKQAVNNYQQIRGNMGGLDQNLHRGFIESKADAYRSLAKLLIDDGRIPEAESVIRLLKQEEYSEFTRGNSTGSNLNEPVAFTQPEQDAETITADELRWIALKARLRGASDGQKKDEDKAEFDRLSQRLRAHNEDFGSAIDRIFSPNGSARKITGETSLMQNVLHETQQRSPNTVGIYTIAQENELDVIVVTQNLKVLSHSVAISRSELSSKVEAFRQLLLNPCSDPRPAALELYNLLVRPIARDLQGAGAKTLVWELDGALHFLPTSALYDGHDYLAHTYSNVIFTMTHSDALSSEVNTTHFRALGMGVSLPIEELPALPAVPAELEGIIHDPEDKKSTGPLPGKILLNAHFTAEAMQSELDSGFPVVHIASHFVLQPGSDKSYLLLGGTDPTNSHSRRLTYADLSNDAGYRFDGVQLLTLSACETGTSGGARLTDGKEIDALGELAESKGAKAVLATLWPVSDASTAEFMAGFYRRWMTKSETPKVQALQQAQLNMLEGNRLDTSHAACRSAVTRGSTMLDPVSQTGPHPKLSHPYYWAPFVLIGNWQ